MINKSEVNRLSKNTEVIESRQGSLRSESSIIDPVIRLQTDSINIANANYMLIPDFGRYYFIKDIVSIRHHLWEISCHVDVISTYADQIRAQTAIIKRQENKYNMYLDDGVFKVYQNPYIITKAFPNGFSTESFVLAVAGG